MRGQKRPPGDRAKALGITLATGNASEASRQTGIPTSTILDWVQSEEFGKLRERTREQVAEEWWGIAQQGFRRVSALIDSTTDIAKVATATAIITDKMLVIRGEATSRYESRDLTGAFDDHELAALRSAIASADGSGPEDSEAAAVGGTGTDGTTPA